MSAHILGVEGCANGSNQGGSERSSAARTKGSSAAAREETAFLAQGRPDSVEDPSGRVNNRHLLRHIDAADDEDLVILHGSA